MRVVDCGRENTSAFRDASFIPGHLRGQVFPENHSDPSNVTNCVAINSALNLDPTSLAHLASFEESQHQPAAHFRPANEALWAFELSQLLWGEQLTRQYLDLRRRQLDGLPEFKQQVATCVFHYYLFNPL